MLKNKGQNILFIQCFYFHLDSSLIGAVPITEGLKQNGIIIINTEKKPEDFSFSNVVAPRIFTVDCSSIAVKYKLGTEAAPIVNTTILGAVAKVTGLVKLQSIMEAIREKIPLKKEENVKAAKESYEELNLQE